MATAGERLHLLYDINRRLTTFADLDLLLRYATRRARELFEAEGCALLLLDHERREFSFPIASQSESARATPAQLAEIRFPADRGIAGWVLAHDEAALVADTASDSRFYQQVDRLTDTQTRSLLCAPLRTPSGNIGVIEVVNPRPESLTPEDLEFLETVASDIAVAYERANLYTQLRSEVIGMRQATGVAGVGFALVGGLVAAGAAVGHLARGLPWSELLTRPAMLIGLLCVAAGVALLGLGRGWLIRHTPIKN